MGYVWSGLVIGAIYALLGGSISLTYRTTGVLNLSVGAQCYAIAYVYYILTTVDGWATWIAGLLCWLVLAPLIGIVLWLVIFRLLERANLIVQLVSTIGITVALPALVQLIKPLVSALQVPGVFPAFKNFTLGPFTTTPNQLATVISAILALILILIFVERSRFGLAMRAVVDRPVLASTRGINPVRVSVSAWILSSLMVGLAGVMLGPLVQLDPDQYDTLAVAALSVALVGRFRSVSVTGLAGFALGVVGALITGYAPAGGGIANAVVPGLPFFLLVILLIIGLSPITTRRDAATVDLDARRRRRTASGASPRRFLVQVVIAVVLGVVASLVMVLAFNSVWTGVMASGTAIAVIFLSFSFSVGEGAVLCLGQAAFAAVGAFTTGRLAADAGLPFLVAAVLGVVAAIVVGTIIALAGSRLDRVGFALVTLAFALFCEQFAFNLTWLVPVTGVSFPIFNFGVFNSEQSEIIVNVVVFAVVAAGLTWLRHSPLGRTAAAVRGNPLLASALGVNVTFYRVVLFALGSGVAGLGGVLFGLTTGSADILDFSLLTGLIWLAVAVTMGVRGFLGPAIAGIAYAVIPAAFTYVHAAGIPNLPTVLFGLGAAGLAQDPRGVVAQFSDAGRAIGARLRRPRAAPAADTESAVRTRTRA